MSWEVSINVAGRQASTGSRALPDGVYAGRVTKVEPSETTTGKQQLKFVVEVADGEFKGIERMTWLTLPTEGDANLEVILNIWRTTLESLGHSIEDLDAGDVAINEENLLNKDCHFSWKNGDKDAEIRPKFYFMTNEAFIKQTGGTATETVETKVATKAVTSTGNKTVTNTTPKLGGKTPGMSKDQIRAALGT